jgi:hypothetical protein
VFLLGATEAAPGRRLDEAGLLPDGAIGTITTFFEAALDDVSGLPGVDRSPLAIAIEAEPLVGDLMLERLLLSSCCSLVRPPRTSPVAASASPTSSVAPPLLSLRGRLLPLSIAAATAFES